MKEAIETRKKDLEEKKFRSIKEAKESAIKELEDYCNSNEKELPEFKKIIE
ncbi:7349_t:CDS:1, partial [Paraglomus brasilianum]